MTSEILQLHVRSVEKQLSVESMCKHFSCKAKDSRRRVWNVLLPLGYLHSMKHLSQFPLFLEPPFGLCRSIPSKSASFWSCSWKPYVSLFKEVCPIFSSADFWPGFTISSRTASWCTKYSMSGFWFDFLL